MDDFERGTDLSVKGEFRRGTNRNENKLPTEEQRDCTTEKFCSSLHVPLRDNYTKGVGSDVYTSTDDCTPVYKNIKSVEEQGGCTSKKSSLELSVPLHEKSNKDSDGNICTSIYDYATEYGKNISTNAQGGCTTGNYPLNLYVPLQDGNIKDIPEIIQASMYNSAATVDIGRRLYENEFYSHRKQLTRNGVRNKLISNSIFEVYGLKMARNSENRIDWITNAVLNCRYKFLKKSKMEGKMPDGTPSKVEFDFESGCTSTSTPKVKVPQDQEAQEVEMEAAGAVGGLERSAGGTSTPRSPKPLGVIIDELENVGFIHHVNMHDEAEFSSETSSILDDIIKVMNDAKLSMMCSNWAEPDPDLEGSIMEILDGLVLHTSLDLEQHLHGWRLDSFDRIGGPGTLRGIWSKLKILKQVVGVKRKLTESLGSDDTSSTDKESIRKFISDNQAEQDSEAWLGAVCELFSQLNLSGDDSGRNMLQGVDVEPQVGSEPDIEGLRLEEHKELVLLADGTMLRRDIDDSINTDDIPELSSSSSSTASSTGTIWGFNGGLEGGRVVEHTWVESQWKAPKVELDEVEQGEFYTMGVRYMDDIALRGLNLTYGGTFGVDEMEPNDELGVSH